MVATGGSVVYVLSGDAIYFTLLNAQYFIRLPDYTPVYVAELCNSSGASSHTRAIYEVFILFGSPSVSYFLSLGSNSSDYVLLSSSEPSCF